VKLNPDDALPAWIYYFGSFFLNRKLMVPELRIKWGRRKIKVGNKIKVTRGKSKFINN
jgi:hypothetical protein